MRNGMPSTSGNIVWSCCSAAFVSCTRDSLHPTTLSCPALLPIAAGRYGIEMGIHEGTGSSRPVEGTSLVLEAKPPLPLRQQECRHRSLAPAVVLTTWQRRCIFG